MTPKGHSVTVLKNRTTGRYAGRVETEFGSGHDDSIDVVPPVGFNQYELTVDPPPKLVNVTPGQLEKSAKRGGPSTQAAHIADALEEKE